MRLKSIIASGLLALSLGIGVLATFSPSPALAQSAVLLPNGKQQFLDSNGAPLAGGTVGFYVPPATLTPKTTWLDAARATPNSNPVTLDSSGEATIYGVGTYRQIVKDALGATIWDAQTSGLGGSLYGGVSTGTANAQALAASDFAGVDGSVVTWIAGFTNTGATTLDGGAGAKSLVKVTPAGAVVLAGGELVANGTYSASWSTSNNRFTLLNPTSLVVSTSIPTEFNGSISASVAANQLTVSILTASGATPSTSSPVTIPFLNAAGTFTYVNVTASTTFTVPAACNLGSASTVLRMLAVFARNSAGGVQIGLMDPMAKVTDTPSIAAVNTASCNATTNQGAMYSTNTGLLAVASTIIGSVQVTYTNANIWSATGLSVQNASPSLVAFFASGLQRGQYGTTLGQTSLGSSVQQTSTPSAPLYPPTAVLYKRQEIILEGVSTTGVSPLAIDTTGICTGASGLVNTFSGAAVASVASGATLGQLTAAMVAANTVSGVIDLYPDALGSALTTNIVYSARIVSSGGIQWLATGLLTGCTPTVLPAGITTNGGVDTFDLGKMWNQAQF